MLTDYIVGLFAAPLADSHRTRSLLDTPLSEVATAIRAWIDKAREGHSDLRCTISDGWSGEWLILHVTSPYSARVGLWLVDQTTILGSSEQLPYIADSIRKDHELDVAVLLLLADETDASVQSAMDTAWSEVSNGPGNVLLLEPSCLVTIIAQDRPPLLSESGARVELKPSTGLATARRIIKRALVSNETKLDLSSHQLTSLPVDLQGLRFLESLSLAGNELSELPEWLGDLRKLKSLDLSRNKLKELPARIMELTELEELDVSQNSLEEVPVVLEGLRALRSLKLNYNDIRDVPAWFGDLQSLSQLSLTACRIERFPEVLCTLSSLVDLDVARNLLSDLPDALATAAEIRKLNVYANRLHAFPEVVCQLKKLKHLNIASNLIEGVGERVVLPSLEILICDDNPLPEQDIREAVLSQPPPRIGEGVFIGEGGFGVVEKLQVNGRLVARKIFRYGGRRDEDYESIARQRFILGAKIMMNLSDPHIVKVFELRDDLPNPYFHMEYFPAGDLAQLVLRPDRSSVASALGIAANGRLLPETIAILLRDVCKALLTAHAGGTFHRDVKPQNIMLRPTSERVQAVLTDFDTAYHSAFDVSVTMSRHITAFSPLWLWDVEDRDAPVVGPALDSYGVCATALFCLTCAFPNPAIAKSVSKYRDEVTGTSSDSSELKALLEAVEQTLTADPQDIMPVSDLEALFARFSHGPSGA